MRALKTEEQTWFWNIRFFLITLVVIGNLVEPAARQSQTAEGLFLWIFSFHIPVFAFVMGYYSKAFTLREDGLKQLLVIAMQYVLFQTVYSAADYFIFHTPGVQYSFFIPFSLLWFLMAHLFWKMLLIPFRRLRHPMLWAVLLGIAIGYVSLTPNLLALSRTFVYFPFFLAGYYFSSEPFERLRRHPAARPAAAAALTGFLAWCLLKGSTLGINAGWLYGNASYAQLGEGGWEAATVRLCWYAAAGMLGLSFLILIPRRQGLITEGGKHSVYIFLWHGLLVKAVVAAGVYGWVTSGAHVLMLAAAGLLIVAALASPAFVKATRVMIEPKPNRLYEAFAKAAVFRHSPRT